MKDKQIHRGASLLKILEVKYIVCFVPVITKWSICSLEIRANKPFIIIRKINWFEASWAWLAIF